MTSIKALLALCLAAGALACGDDDVPAKAADAGTSSTSDGEPDAARAAAEAGTSSDPIGDIIRRFGDGGFRLPGLGDAGLRGRRGDGGARGPREQDRDGDGSARGPRDRERDGDGGREGRSRDGGRDRDRDRDEDGGTEPERAEDAAISDAGVPDAAI